MVLTECDIKRLKAKLESETRKCPVVTGYPTQYFFAHDTEDGNGGICGLNVILLDVQDNEELGKDIFTADLAILSEVPGFYVECLGVVVTSISLMDAQGNKSNGLCRACDIDVVEETMNMKFRIDGKPDLQLIVDNTDEAE